VQAASERVGELVRVSNPDFKIAVATACETAGLHDETRSVVADGNRATANERSFAVTLTLQSKIPSLLRRSVALSL
jgi:hypothetical protein